MQLYVRNMQVICNYMSEICKKYAQYIDCISQIWKKYALNMPEICTNMQIICSYMLKICSYMPKICNKYAQYIDCISRICKKYAAKICRNMQFICKICISLYIAYIAFICTPHFADVGCRHSSWGWVVQVSNPHRKITGIPQEGTQSDDSNCSSCSRLRSATVGRDCQSRCPPGESVSWWWNSWFPIHTNDLVSDSRHSFRAWSRAGSP